MVLFDVVEFIFLSKSVATDNGLCDIRMQSSFGTLTVNYYSVQSKRDDLNSTSGVVVRD